jgi:hypothetical protein
MKFRALHQLSNFLFSKKKFSTNNTENNVQIYSRGTRWLHFISAFGFVGCTISGCNAAD